MTEAAEEFDLARAPRRVAFHREIPTASLEGYWQRWDAPDIRNDPSTAPALMADEYAALVTGEAVLQLPDGSRWISVAALCWTDEQDAEEPRDNPWLQRLTGSLWGTSGAPGPRRPVAPSRDAHC